MIRLPISWLLVKSNEIARSQHGESHPWQRSWGRGLTGKGEIRPRGNPRGLSWASTPKLESVRFIKLYLSPTLLTLTGAIPHHLSLKRVNLELQIISLLGVTRVFQSKNSSDGSLACLTSLSGLLKPHMWLFTASQPWEARDTLNFLNTESFEKLEIISVVLVDCHKYTGGGFHCRANICC